MTIDTLPNCPSARRFAQVDVFSEDAFLGNPVAVVLDAEGLTNRQMEEIARWTNLSETTFVLPPTNGRADYRIRIFTPTSELPFAGHPTLGSAHAWLAADGSLRSDGTLVQESTGGLVTLTSVGGVLHFEAPPLIHTGPLDSDLLESIAAALRIDLESIRAHQWVDNGPGWAGIELANAAEVLALEPDFTQFPSAILGVIGRYPEGGPVDVEVRSFPLGLGIAEDAVTGSLNAGFAQWLIPEGRLPSNYTAGQGTKLGRAGRVSVRSSGDAVLIGGSTNTLVSGTLTA